ncbi:MAG: helical backbone metal receptor [Bdellovibrionota bacterium]
MSQKIKKEIKTGIISDFKVVSLVPSLTETFLSVGVNVVGRTRFCCHPIDRVKSIPIVGGTKQARWVRIKELCPDLVVIDKEENPKSFSEHESFNFAITHFSSLAAAGVEFFQLADKFPPDLAEKIAVIGSRYQSAYSTAQKKHMEILGGVEESVERAVPALLKWVKKPSKKIKQVLYLIWHDPWMTISQDTFIHSILSCLGLDVYLPRFESKYPTIELSEFDPDHTLLLCASEPFPFHKKTEIISELKYPAALVDGEVLSWFGIRNLQFMERHL